jgi:transposase InsO family protein
MMKIGARLDAFGTSMNLSKGDHMHIGCRLERDIFIASLDYVTDKKPNIPTHGSTFTMRVMKADEEACLEWHRKVGHMGKEYMRMLVSKNLAEGIPLKRVVPFTCPECQLGRLTQKPFQKAEKLPVTEKLGLIHMDVCGPIPKSRHGYIYFATITDDATRYKWVILLKTRRELAAKFQNWVAFVERQSDRKLKAVRTDNALEFTGSEFEEFLTEHGIDHQFSIPHTPQQNGVAERLNRSLVEKVRTMLIQAKLPVSYWEYALGYSC